MGDLQGGSFNLVLALAGIALLQYLTLNLVRLLKRSWWDPIRITKAMEAQGIRGPPYKFFHGSTAEASELLAGAMAGGPMELSHNIIAKVQPHFHSWIKLYGRNVLTWHGPTPRLLVGEPELAKEILNDREGRITKYDPPEFMKKLLGDGLVTTKGEKWARQRKLATHAFHSESLKGMIPAIIASVEAMLQNWIKLEGKEVDFFKEFTVLTSEVISKTAFGSSYIEGKDIFTKLDELTLIAARNSQTVRLPYLRKIVRNKDEIESDKLEQEVRASILKLIRSREQRKENRDADGYGDDLLGLLMRAHHETGSLTIDDIIDECKTFYFAGQETTSIMLSWTCMLLSINTDWQERVRMEVRQLFGDRNPRSEDSSAIARPPVLQMVRVVARECRVGDYLLPQGLQIHISPLAIHRDSSTWGDDAQLFLPERFADGVAGATAANGGMAFFPFGFGPRFCVGQGLAMLEAKVALAMILQRYSFTISPSYAHSPAPYPTCRPLHGIQAVIQKL